MALHRYWYEDADDDDDDHTQRNGEREMSIHTIVHALTPDQVIRRVRRNKNRFSHRIIETVTLLHFRDCIHVTIYNILIYIYIKRERDTIILYTLLCVCVYCICILYILFGQKSGRG